MNPCGTSGGGISTRAWVQSPQHRARAGSSSPTLPLRGALALKLLLELFAHASRFIPQDRRTLPLPFLVQLGSSLVESLGSTVQGRPVSKRHLSLRHIAHDAASVINWVQVVGRVYIENLRLERERETLRHELFCRRPGQPYSYWDGSYEVTSGGSPHGAPTVVRNPVQIGLLVNGSAAPAPVFIGTNIPVLVELQFLENSPWAFVPGQTMVEIRVAPAGFQQGYEYVPGTVGTPPPQAFGISGAIAVPDGATATQFPGITGPYVQFPFPAGFEFQAGEAPFDVATTYTVTATFPGDQQNAPASVSVQIQVQSH